MARLTPSAGTLPLVTGIAAATALSGAAVFTVIRSGCEDPGVYQFHDGVVELIGGCVQPQDLPVVPAREPGFTPRPMGSAHHPADPSRSP
jgi:hypothetical protein